MLPNTLRPLDKHKRWAAPFKIADSLPEPPKTAGHMASVGRIRPPPGGPVRPQTTPDEGLPAVQTLQHHPVRAVLGAQYATAHPKREAFSIFRAAD